MKLCVLVLTLISAGSLLAWRTASGNLPVLVEPVSVTPEVAVVNGSGIQFGEPKQVNFNLMNRSDRPVTISDVRHCCGNIPLRDLRAHVLRPGESVDLPVHFDVPAAGVTTTKIEVLHDGSRVPVELRALLVGRRELPYVVEKGRRQVDFLDLTSVDAIRTLRISTCEGAGMPWLGAAACDMPGITVERVDVRQQRVGSVFIRTYEYRVGWAKMPEAREFYGKITAKTAYGDPRLGMPAKVEIGTVIGTCSIGDEFSPRVGRLNATGDWSDVIVFARRSEPGRWQFRSGWMVPPWIESEWFTASDHQMLRLSLRSPRWSNLPADFVVPLVFGGLEVGFPVRIDRP
jgi:hypothetical protein